MELLNSLRRGNLLFKNRTIYSFYHHKSHGKVKDKEHLNLRCLVNLAPGILSQKHYPRMQKQQTSPEFIKSGNLKTSRIRLKLGKIKYGPKHRRKTKVFFLMFLYLLINLILPYDLLIEANLISFVIAPFLLSCKVIL